MSTSHGGPRSERKHSRKAYDMPQRSKLETRVAGDLAAVENAQRAMVADPPRESKVRECVGSTTTHTYLWVIRSMSNRLSKPAMADWPEPTRRQRSGTLHAKKEDFDA